MIRGKEEPGYVLKAEPRGFSAGWNGRWESRKSIVALRTSAWKQQERQGCYRDREDGERHRFGGLSGQV